MLKRKSWKLKDVLKRRNKENARYSKQYLDSCIKSYNAGDKEMWNEIVNYYLHYDDKENEVDDESYKQIRAVLRIKQTRRHYNRKCPKQLSFKFKE